MRCRNDDANISGLVRGEPDTARTNTTFVLLIRTLAVAVPAASGTVMSRAEAEAFKVQFQSVGVT